MPQTQSGNVVALSTQPGVDAWGQMTQVPINDGTPNGTVTGSGMALSGSSTGNPTSANNPNTVYYLIGFILCLVAAKYFTEHESSKMNVHFVGIGVYNWAAIGLMSVTFIVAFKSIFNLHYVKVISEIFNAA